jgi:diguanylate cyclase (GGDEF)-like protein
MNRTSVHQRIDTAPATAEAVCLVDSRQRVVAADATAEQWSEVLAAPPVTEALARLLAGEDGFAALVELGESEPGLPRMQVRMRRLEGDDGPMALVAFQPDSEIVFRDAVTGLPDRRAIVDRVARWRSASEGRTPFAVLFLDLDGFKRVNDEHGHAAGDRVLEEIARRLVHCVREEDLVARYGGDEFVLLLKDVAAAADAEPVIERLQTCVRQPIAIGPLRLQLGATIGIAVPDSPSQPIDEFIAAADQDMYARKRRRLK